MHSKSIASGQADLETGHFKPNSFGWWDLARDLPHVPSTSSSTLWTGPRSPSRGRRHRSSPCVRQVYGWTTGQGSARDNQVQQARVGVSWHVSWSAMWCHVVPESSAPAAKLEHALHTPSPPCSGLKTHENLPSPCLFGPAGPPNRSPRRGARDEQRPPDARGLQRGASSGVDGRAGWRAS